MKIIVSRDLLQEKLGLASRFTSTKLTTISTLQGVLLQGEKNNLTFYSTDLTSYFSTKFTIESNQSFQIIIEPKKIIEFLQFLNPGKIELEIKEKQLLISQNKTKGNFPAIVSAEFPLPPDIKKKEQKINIDFLKETLPLLFFATSHDETRPTLTGVNFVAAEEELIIITTDGFRLSLIKTKERLAVPSMLIPSDFLTEILRFTKEEKNVGFRYSSEEKVVQFTVSDTNFYSRLIEGEFPPYERVVPTEKKTTVVVEKEELLRNVKLISVFARDYSNVVICEFQKEGLFIRPKKDSGTDTSAYQEIELKGEEQKVAFNYKFLLDLLNTINAQSLKIEILRADAPIVFKSDKHPGFLHIIMPVRIQE